MTPIKFLPVPVWGDQINAFKPCSLASRGSSFPLLHSPAKNTSLPPINDNNSSFYFSPPKCRDPPINTLKELHIIIVIRNRALAGPPALPHLRGGTLPLLPAAAGRGV